jgi:urease accessory protein
VDHPAVLTDLNKTRTTAVAGIARLTFARNGSQTILERSFASSPVKLFTTRPRGAACWVYSATLGGGLVGGDNVRMMVDLKDGTRALLATQASTKVYRSLRRASQAIVANVDNDALLAVMPDPIVCFSGADFLQTQRYDLRRSANLVVIDWITSGRHLNGERWAFSRFESRLDVRRDGRRVLYDGLLLESDFDSVGARMGRFHVYVTVVSTGPLISREAAVVASGVLHEVSKNSELIESAATLNDGGTLFRIAGVDLEHVARVLRQHLTYLQPLLGDDPWSRKW